MYVFVHVCNVTLMCLCMTESRCVDECVCAYMRIYLCECVRACVCMCVCVCAGVSVGL